MLTGHIAKLQSAFREQEAQAILLEPAYRICEKPKEMNDLIFAKYLSKVEDLRSKVEDMTHIMELEGLLESNGIVVTKRSDGTFTRAFTEGDPDGNIKDETDECVDESGVSDDEVGLEPSQVIADPEDDHPELSCCMDLQVRSNTQP
ncbi:hypothetical protein R1sor_020931 [Riccia sorocarpa]|uniref:Uncharacterized protein n=1 Tax=Riccia sorocarpa TaxID=122646 RepID=A0ABD3GIR5_9MARC